VFKTKFPILEAQIIQEHLDTLRVLYVPAPDFVPGAEAGIAEQLRLRMGPVRVLFEQIEQIPRERNGKFRAVVNRVSSDELAQVRPSSI
jgi:hypothetical protein